MDDHYTKYLEESELKDRNKLVRMAFVAITLGCLFWTGVFIWGTIAKGSIGWPELALMVISGGVVVSVIAWISIKLSKYFDIAQDRYHSQFIKIHLYKAGGDGEPNGDL